MIGSAVIKAYADARKRRGRGRALTEDEILARLGVSDAGTNR